MVSLKNKNNNSSRAVCDQKSEFHLVSGGTYTGRGKDGHRVDKRRGERHFLPARRYASAGLCDSNVSVCPSVRPSHAGILCLAERKQDSEMYTI